MPRQPLDASHESTAGIQPAAAPAAVAEAPAAEAEDFDFSDSMISKALSEDLDTMEPGDVFSASGKYPEPGEEPAEHLLTGTLTETGLQAIPEDYMENENGIAGSLEDPMLLLETEYEDEFMSSQILEHTAIKKALAKSDDDRPKAEDAEDKETEAAPD
jgi:hypothetical protein